MAYKKTKGLLYAKIIGYTPYWIDVKNNKSQQICCIFLKNKMSDKMKAMIDNKINYNALTCFCVSKKDGEDYHYNFHGFAKGIQSLIKTKRIIAEESLEREINSQVNFVKGKQSSKLLTGKKGLVNFERTSNKLSRAIHLGINNDAEKAAIKEKNRIIKEKRECESILRKLRRKFFNDREWMMLPIKLGGTDLQWDEFLWKNKEELSNKKTKEYKDFIEELKALGL